MLPLGHAALGYLLYAGYVRLSDHRIPLRYTIVPLAIGTQFPDLVDKPLAYLELLAYGRSLAHSLFTLVVASTLVWWVAKRTTARPLGGWKSHVSFGAPAAFTIGYVAHLIGDAQDALLAGNFFDARFLVYPLYVLPESPADDIPPWTRLVHIYQQMETHPQLELILVAAVVFVGARIRNYRNNPRPPDASSGTRQND